MIDMDESWHFVPSKDTSYLLCVNSSGMMRKIISVFVSIKLLTIFVSSKSVKKVVNA